MAIKPKLIDNPRRYSESNQDTDLLRPNFHRLDILDRAQGHFKEEAKKQHNA